MSDNIKKEHRELSLEEMKSLTPEELFKEFMWIAEVTVNRRFNSKGFYDAHILSKDEVIQFALIGVWDACNSYDFSKATSPNSFRNYCISMSYNRVRDYSRDNSLRVVVKRDRKKVELDSFDVPVGSEAGGTLELHDVVPSEELYTTYKDYRGEFYNTLSEENKMVIDMYIVDSDLKKISTILGNTRQSISQRLMRIRKNLINDIYSICEDDIIKILTLKILKKNEEEISKVMKLEYRKVEQLLRKYKRDILKSNFLAQEEDLVLLDYLTRYLNNN